MNNPRMFRKISRRLLPLAALAACLAVLGCLRMDVIPQSRVGLQVPMSEPRPVSHLVVPKAKDPTKVYRIGPRDVLRVDVRKDPAISQVQGYTVTEEGNILLPYIGPVKVADLTVGEAEKQVNSLLGQYIREPDAKVGVQDYRSKFVYVVGQVRNPGRLVMKADMLTLQEALFAAGLPTADAAMQRAHVITPADEQPIVRQIDLTDIIYKGRMAENMLLSPNDIVYVPSKNSSNLSAVIADLLRPIDQVVDIGYKAKYGFGNGSNNSNGNNNNNSSGGGFFGN